MNLILFEAGDPGHPLPIDDPRARHLLTVLRRREGDRFDAGLVDGPRGKGTIVEIRADSLVLAFEWGAEPPPLAPLRLLVGLPRPQTARKILGEATALGVGGIDFFISDRGEPGYAQSTLWSSGEWRRHIVAGAEQAFCTRLPAVTWAQPLRTLLAGLPAGGTRIALDNYEASSPLSAPPGPQAPVALAFGPERGWSPEERILLREAGFSLRHLGPRVLRAETAVVAAVSLALAGLGRI